MKLTVKNKYVAAMEDLITSAVKRNGVPDEFQVSQLEYARFLQDVWMMDDSVSSVITVNVIADDERFSITGQIFSQNTPSDQVLKELVDKWVKKEYNILYKDIPVVPLIKKAKVSETKETAKPTHW